jgi:Na+/melibiose symporter-like transporter
MEKSHYGKLLVMLILSFIIMYSVMFFNVDRIDNIRLNLNRLYMTILMVAPMAVIMLLLMSSMFKNKKTNNVIFIISIAAILGAFLMLRTQAFVGDIQFMNSMIPHHSSAILVSEQSVIRDPEVQKLAQQIIESQKEEIAEMKKLLAKLNK